MTDGLRSIFVRHQQQAEHSRGLCMKASSRSWSRQSLELSKRQICIQVLRPLLEIPIDKRMAGKENSIKGRPKSISVEACSHSRCPMQLSSASQGKTAPWRRLKTCHCRPRLIYLEHLQGPCSLLAQLGGTLCGLTGLRHRDCGVKRGVAASNNEASLYRV